MIPITTPSISSAGTNNFGIPVERSNPHKRKAATITTNEAKEKDSYQDNVKQRTEHAASSLSSSSSSSSSTAAAAQNSLPSFSFLILTMPWSNRPPSTSQTTSAAAMSAPQPTASSSSSSSSSSKTNLTSNEQVKRDLTTMFAHPQLAEIVRPTKKIVEYQMTKKIGTEGDYEIRIIIANYTHCKISLNTHPELNQNQQIIKFNNSVLKTTDKKIFILLDQSRVSETAITVAFFKYKNDVCMYPMIDNWDANIMYRIDNDNVLHPINLDARTSTEASSPATISSLTEGLLNK